MHSPTTSLAHCCPNRTTGILDWLFHLGFWRTPQLHCPPHKVHCRFPVVFKEILRLLSYVLEQSEHSDFDLVHITCPGMKLLRIIGSPLIKASAMVPGPAYVTRLNQHKTKENLNLVMGSNRLEKKPLLWCNHKLPSISLSGFQILLSDIRSMTCLELVFQLLNTGNLKEKDITFVGTVHSIESRFDFSTWLRPQMTTICPLGLWHSSSKRTSPSAFAVSSTGPIPSPPPISRTAGRWESISNSFLNSSCLLI